MPQDMRHYDRSPRRRSPPYGARPSGAARSSQGIQIRGLAREREERNARDYGNDGRNDPQRHPPQDYDSYRNDAGLHYDDQRSSRDGRGDTYRPISSDDRPAYDRKPRRRSPSRSESRSPRRDDRRYRDRDAPNYRSSPERQVSNNTSTPQPKPDNSFGAVPPSREVILEGLPDDMLEDDIKSELKAYHVEDLEDVRVIKDKKTGRSKQFGFLKFSSIEASKTFIERNGPSIHLYGMQSSDQNGAATAVKIAFCKERPEREPPNPDAEWQCNNCGTPNFSTRKDCRRCGASGADAPVIGNTLAQPTVVNTGESDISPDATPSHILLFRHLEPTVSEEMLARGASKLIRSHEAREELLAESSSSSTMNASTGNKLSSTAPNAKPSKPTAVAQSAAGARPGCIRRVLLIRDRQTNDSWRYGFVEFASVEDATNALAKYQIIERFTIASKPVTVSYIHAGVFVPDLRPTPETERFTFPTSTNPALKLIYRDEAAYVSVLVVTSPEADQASQAREKKAKDDAATSKQKKRKADTATSASEGLKPKKQMASHLQFWTNRHAELRGQQPKSSDTAEGMNPAAEQATATSSHTESPGTPSRQSYADPTKHCCYLCARQFTTATEVNKHERLSDLHRSNLTKPDTVSKAKARLEKEGLPIVSSSETAPTGSEDLQQQTQEYRDRARERRRMNANAQPKAAHLPRKDNATTTATSPTSNAVAASEEQTNPPPPIPPQSKAALMLQKMGHIQGQGLGSSNTGSVAPIETNVYSAGVGLGAEGGNLGDAVERGDRATRGEYGDFVRDVRERARERFRREG